MSILNATALTMADWRNRLGPDGSIADIMEVLAQSNPIMDDMTFMEGNLSTGIQTTERTSVPEPSVRRINQGVGYTKSSVAPIVDTTTMFESRSKVDVALLRREGSNAARFRFSEDLAHVAGFGNKLASMVIYGNTANTPDEFNGLAVRMADLSNSSDPTKRGYTTISNGNAGANNASIYFVKWGERTCSGIFPKDGQAGLQKKDLGEQTMSDGANGDLEYMVTRFNWDIGLTLRDFRSCGRLCNIDAGLIASSNAAQRKNLVEKIVTLHDRLRDPNVVMYAPRGIYTLLKLCLMDNNNAFVTPGEIKNGMQEVYVDGIKVVKLDCLRTDEAAVQ